jgi:aerobic-type carbon monoxide dehydrogenase small subunit (CoxS/CutS family)
LTEPLTLPSGGVVTIVCDGRDLRVSAGVSVAAALLTHGVHTFRRSVSGEGRAAFCGMGICHECRVTINGIPHRRACLITVLDGLDVVTEQEAAS